MGRVSASKDSRSRLKQQRVAHLRLTIAIALLIVPLFALWWVREMTTDYLFALDPPPLPITFIAHERLDDRQQSVIGEITWGTPNTALSPIGLSGTVTEVYVEVGEELDDYAPILAVNGVGRIGLYSALPFYRPLARGDTGEDVKLLQRMLTRLGHYSGPIDGVVGFSTTEAIREWETRLGVHRPAGIFQPDWTIYLGTEPFAVDALMVKVGAPVPPAGDPILIAPSALETFIVRLPGGGVPVLDGSWNFRSDELSVPLENGQVTQRGIEELEAHVPRAMVEFDGTVVLVDPVLIIDLPPTAVVTDPDGSLCVFVADSGGFRARGIEVTGGPSGSGATSGLSEGEVVLANPHEYLQTPECR